MRRLLKALFEVVGLCLLAGTLALIGHLDAEIRIAKSAETFSVAAEPSAEESAVPLSASAPAVAVPTPPTFVPPAVPEPDAVLRRSDYDAVRQKSILELQQFRRIEVLNAAKGEGLSGRVSLVNLNPNSNAWYLLTLDWDGPRGRATYHIENPDPAGQQLHLLDSRSGGIVIFGRKEAIACDLWTGKRTALDIAREASLAYAPLCDGRLYLRNQVTGHRSNLEAVTDFLRDNIWQGDAIVGFVRDSLFEDAYREPGKVEATNEPPPVGTLSPALVGSAYANKAIVPADLGINAEVPASRQLELGRWYGVRNIQGVYLSAMQPVAVSDDIIKRDKGALNSIDAVESSSVDYLVAFDLSQYQLRYALGTDHPRLGWSPRVPGDVRDGRLPGPDGVATTAPLVTTGLVNPSVLGDVVAAFAGGFKREHGGFKWGSLSHVNGGSHYGFIENGVVFSKLQPGLATLFSLDDGSVQMKTWTADDDRMLAHVRFARQNGVSLVEGATATGEPLPGPFVSNWGAGNWSGSADSKLRTLRAGACIQQVADKPFLIYGYFSTATPSAMATVFQAYGCRYAMLLDMNSIEHTYFALYARRGDKVAVEHLVRGMASIDPSSKDQLIPRFVGAADNRDFFYLVKRKVEP